jgi:hypothetical protein
MTQLVEPSFRGAVAASFSATSLRFEFWSCYRAGGIVASLVPYVIPFWPEGRRRVAFWLIMASTLLHVLASRRRKPIERGGPDA